MARLTWLARSQFYRDTAEQYRRFFVELGGLRPTDRVLDVGCGSGRITLGLVDYLGGGGSYEGLDVLPGEIRWCQQHITRHHPEFRFQVADIANQHYNPAGTQTAGDYHFPYPDASFDFVYLVSVFSHMLPDGVDHYLAEITRVLRPGGRCAITYYLLNDTVDPQKASIDFPYERTGYRAHNAEDDTWAVAYEEANIRHLYDKHGLRIKEPIAYGAWTGRESAYDLQDMIVAQKA